MSAPAAPAAPAATTSTAAMAPTVTPTRNLTSVSGCISAASTTIFTIPHGIGFKQFEGTDWNMWSRTFMAILGIHEAQDVLRFNVAPTGVDADEWGTTAHRVQMLIQLYVRPDLFSVVNNDTLYPTVYNKWVRLGAIHGGESGSTMVFNQLTILVDSRIDDTQPLAPQFAKLNEARINLANVAMGITDNQYALILLCALPASYEALQSILLASGPAGTLTAEDIVARAINEEGRRGLNPASLSAHNKAPIKSMSGNKKDHSTLTCHYCQKKGHISPNCHKKKRDEKEKKKPGQASSSDGTKATNSHVHTTASIEEVVSDNESVGVALYSSWRERWLVDSGATHHMTPHRSDFVNYTACGGSVRVGDVATTSQVGVGSVVFHTSQGVKISLSNVLHLPGTATRFISEGALADKGALLLKDSGSIKISVKGKCIAQAYRENKLYWLDIASGSLSKHIKHTLSLDLWHQHMGHVSHATLKAHGSSALKGMDLDDSTIPQVCYGCEMGKSTRDSFSATVRPKKTTRTFEIVHSDLCGPMQSNSIQGSSYYASFIDDFSNHSLVYFLKQKSQFVQAFKLFLAWGETQSGYKLKALHSDRGGEYIGKDTQDILKQKGIEHHLTMPGSAQQNGKAERFNRTIMDKALAMQHTAGLSYGFWEFAVESAVHIYNRTPTRVLKWQTPYAVWNNGTIPDITYLRVFGCKGYKLWDCQTRSVKLSRDVTFDESSFPSRKDSTAKAGPPQPATTLTLTVPVTAPSTSELPP